jgi:hypothetical protein
MNLNKYSKTELMNKLKNYENSVNKKSITNLLRKYLSETWNLILVFKNILIKLSFIGIFIQLFKKFKIFRTLWVMLNSIVMTIFGISMIENFSFDFISNFIR